MSTTNVSSTLESSKDLVKDRYPPQIKYIVGNEAAERYSYYGMKSILTIFMIQYLMIDKVEATTTYHMFTAACYLFPVLGGFISDRFLGKYKTILYLSVVYCAGHAVLAVWENQLGMYWGLGLIALGSGGIKPCVSAHVGDQFVKGQEHLLRKVFDLFYWMINFGSTFSTLITPWTLQAYGPGVAFGIPGVLMGVATLLFWMGRNHFVHVPPTGKNPHSLLRIFVSAVKNRKPGVKFLDGATEKHSSEAVEGVRAALSVGLVFSMVTLFWSMFDQHGSTWVIQAKEMNLHFMGMDLLPSQISALNPIMVMCLIPIMSYGVYPLIGKFIEVTPLRKMGVGMVVAALSFAMVGLIQTELDAGNKLNVMWQFFPYLTITIAEVMVSITGLEFAYTQAPRSMKSTIMSFWMLTIFAGNLLAGVISQINVFEGAHFFYTFTIMTLVAAFIFALIARKFKERNYMEK
ncbi:MAG: POT family MFS transporter [Halobacteriovoraceae bacterium]|nr:POT family MFS transporter [Halobacteriovoraceae bacterium]